MMDRNLEKWLAKALVNFFPTFTHALVQLGALAITNHETCWLKTHDS